MKILSLFLILFFQTAFAAEIENTSGEFQVGFGFSYGFNGLMKFDPVINNSGSSLPHESTLEFKFSDASSVEVDFRYSKKYSLGFMAGADFDQVRAVISGKITAVGQVWILPRDSDLNLKVTTYFLSATYRSDEFYFPFGVNLSSVQMSSVDGQFGKLSVEGGLGWQLGVGYYLTDYIAFELISRKVIFKLNGQFENGANIDFGQGGFMNMLLSAKVMF